MTLHFADLTLAAIAQCRFAEYILWSAVRTRKTARGFGYLEHADVRAVARNLRMSGTSLRRTLTSGAGIFWDRGKAGTLHPRSPVRVAQRLHVGAFRAAFFEPQRTLRSRTRRARLAIMAIAALRKGKPTSVEVQARLLNATERTAQRYGRSAGLPVRENFLYIADVTRETARTVPLHASLRVRYHRGRPIFVRQLPNSFPAVGRGVRTHLRRCNRRLRAGQPPSTYPGRGNSRPLYDGRRPDSDPSPLYTLAGTLHRSGPWRDLRPVARLWTYTLPSPDQISSLLRRAPGLPGRPSLLEASSPFAPAPVLRTMRPGEAG